MRSVDAYEAVDRMWKKTTKMLLGDEVGELEQFDHWLGEFVDPVMEKKSSTSGKEVYFAVPHYCTTEM